MDMKPWLLRTIPLLALLAFSVPAAMPAAAVDPPTISISDATQPFESDSGSGQIAFTVSLSAPSSQPTIVSFATGDDPIGTNRAAAGGGTCSNGEDYLELSSAVTIPANSNSPPSAQVLIATCGDTLDEFDETFVVNIFSPSPSLVIADSQARGTIVDDDTSPTVSISRSSSAVFFEGNAGTTNVGFNVTLSRASGKTVTVLATPANGTATGGGACGGAVDFLNTAIPLITFQPAETTKTINVPVCGDMLVESNQTFSVGLSAPTNASPGTSSATATITDDDTPPTISINNVTTVEGSVAKPLSHLATFTVTLSRPFGQPLTVELTTANGTASTGSQCTTLDFQIIKPDYQRVGTPRIVTFAAYQTTSQTAITVCHDTLAEPNETFFVNLQNPSAGTFSDAQGLGTITNDDAGAGTFVLSPDDATVEDGDGVTYTLEWTVPDPLNWHDLTSLDLRLRDEQGIAIWLRWDEADNFFHLVNPTGRATGGGGAPGDARVLSGKMARLDLATSSVVGSGPTGPGVTLTLDLSFKSNARGHTFMVEVAGLDDQGHQDAFMEVGTLTVN
jgi:large repetitive protein